MSCDDRNGQISDLFYGLITISGQQIYSFCPRQDRFNPMHSMAGVPLAFIVALGASHASHDAAIKALLDGSGAYEKDLVKFAQQRIIPVQVGESALVISVRKTWNVMVTMESWDRCPIASRPAWRIIALALVILFLHYPASWAELFNAAFLVVCQVLTAIRDKHKTRVFPPKWTSRIFEVENLLAPAAVRSVMFGIDPLPCSVNGGASATGFAFCFEEAPHSEERKSSDALRKIYQLTHFKLHSARELADFKTYLLRRCGLALINVIRMIPEGSRAGTENTFWRPWSTYHASWLQLIKASRSKGHPEVAVLFFQNPWFPYTEYCGDMLPVLQELKVADCCHPSYVKDRYRTDIKIIKRFLQSRSIDCGCIGCLCRKIFLFLCLFCFVIFLLLLFISQLNVK